MLRFVLLAVLALIAFLVAVIGPLAATGQLKTAMEKVLGRGDAENAAALIVAPDEANELAKALNERAGELDARKERLDELENRLNIRRSEIDEQLDYLEEQRAEVFAALDKLDAAQQQGLNEVALTLAAMKPAEAAMDLEQMLPEQAAELLPLIEERKRGKMLDAMIDKDKRAAILDIMQDRKY